jgi:hypothetical protein
LGIGDWAQSPIPNPQSPIPKSPNYKLNIFVNEIYFILLGVIKKIIIFLKN